MNSMLQRTSIFRRVSNGLWILAGLLACLAGGVAMVICPPAGVAERPVKNLPPVPTHRFFPTGNDH